LVAGGGVAAMAVVVDVPDLDRGGPFGLAGPDAGVEKLLGQEPVVSLHLAVVPWRVGADALVARRDGCHRPDERLRGVVRAVVGDHADRPGDAVGGEERPGALGLGALGGLVGG